MGQAEATKSHRGIPIDRGEASHCLGKVPPAPLRLDLKKTL